MRTKTSLILFLVLALAAAPAGAFERGQVEITPSVGLYTATADNLSETVPGVGSVTARRASTVAGGLRLTFWMRPSLAFELGGFYVPGTLDGQAFGVEGEMGADSFFGSGRFVFSPGSSSGARVLFSAGLVLASQSYEFVDGSTFMAGVVGLGLHVPLGSTASLRLDLDDYIYNAWWELDDLRTTSITQHDMVATAGISFNLGN